MITSLIVIKLPWRPGRVGGHWETWMSRGWRTQPSSELQLELQSEFWEEAPLQTSTGSCNSGGKLYSDKFKTLPSIHPSFLPSRQTDQGVSSKEFLLVRIRAKLKTWYIFKPEPSLAQKFHLLPSPSRGKLGIRPAFEPEPSLALLLNWLLSRAEPAKLWLFGSGFCDLIKLCHRKIWQIFSKHGLK